MVGGKVKISKKLLSEIISALEALKYHFPFAHNNFRDLKKRLELEAK